MSANDLYRDVALRWGDDDHPALSLYASTGSIVDGLIDEIDGIRRYLDPALMHFEECRRLRAFRDCVIGQSRGDGRRPA